MEFGGGHLAPRLSWPCFRPYVVGHSSAGSSARGLSNAALAGLRDPRQAVEKVRGRSAAGGYLMAKASDLTIKFLIERQYRIQALKRCLSSFGSPTPAMLELLLSKTWLVLASSIIWC